MKLPALFLLAGFALAAESNGISGTVQQALTGELLSNVALVLTTLQSDGPAFRTNSRPDGKFEFKDVTAGTYQLVAEKAGFLPAQHGARTANAAPILLTLPANGLNHLWMPMTPQAVIAGRVIDEDGRPVRSAVVRVLEKRNGQLMPSQGMATNERGEFWIGGVRGGTVYLSAGQPMMPNSKFVTTYFPSTTDPSAAVAITVAAGQQIAGQQITLRRGELFAVRGKANVPAGTRVVLSPRGGGTDIGGLTRVRADGSFEISNVAPGDYNLVLRKEGNRPMNLGQMPVTVARANVENIQVTVQPLVAVRGVVTLDAVPATRLEGLELRMLRTDSMADSAKAHVAGDGTFQFNDVGRVKYRLILGSSANFYLKKVIANGKVVTDAGLDFAGGARDLQIVLGTKPAKLTGFVTRGQASGVVRIWRPDFQSVMTLDQNSAFRFPPLAPGKYRVMAIEEYPRTGEPPEAVLKKLESKVVTVQLAEGQSLSIRLQQIGRKELVDAGMEMGQ